MKQEKIELLNLFKEEFGFKVVETDKNPQMKDFNGRHFKIYIKNKLTNQEKIFIYSQGLGIKETDDENIIFGLISCFYMDLPYIDLEEFEGLGYTGKEAVKIYESICKQHDKLNELGFLAKIENLTDEAKKLLN
jgi:hypothetical protein